MQWIIIQNGFRYKITTGRVPSDIRNKFIKDQIDYIPVLHENKFLTFSESKHSLDILTDYKKHSVHATLNVEKQNLETGEIQKFNFAITSSPKPVTILPSLSELLLGETPKTFNVIKINEGLYITSHSISNALDLKFEQFKYDKDLDCYIEVTTNQPFKITKNDMENMSSVVISKIESSEGVKKIDITSMGDLKNDVVSYTILKNEFFNQNTYQECGQKIDSVHELFIRLEKEYGKFIKSSELPEE